MFQKTRNKIINIAVILCCISFGTYIILYNLHDNIVYFYPPSELYKVKNIHNKVRIGGIVKPTSIQTSANQNISFVLTDNIKDIKIFYQGMLPALFREGQGVVAEGKIISENEFVASSLLTKHDENYKPPTM